MVFHEIDSITDVISGHRIIIYYIEGTKSNAKKLGRILETVMEMLEKKNDDLLVIKVLHASVQFTQFKELYNPEIKGDVTLFVVNNEGIPLMSEQINQEENISNSIVSLSSMCKLNCIAINEIAKISQSEAEPISVTPDMDRVTSKSIEVTESVTSRSVADTASPIITHEIAKDLSSSSVVSAEGEIKFVESCKPLSTELQIRLPDGNRDKQKFNKDAMLQEVWIFISVKYKLKDFDLKTYNHQPFSEEEYEKTLQDLDLYPNGVIIVILKNVAPFNNNVGFGVMIHYGFRQLMNKSTSVFRYVQGLLFMFWNSLFFSNNSDRPARRQIKPPQGSSDEQSSSQRGSTKSASSKTFGNVHTLHRTDDSDDENNRYNGNSTQQK